MRVINSGQGVLQRVVDIGQWRRRAFTRARGFLNGLLFAWPEWPEFGQTLEETTEESKSERKQDKQTKTMESGRARGCFNMIYSQTHQLTIFGASSSLHAAGRTSCEHTIDSSRTQSWIGGDEGEAKRYAGWWTISAMPILLITSSSYRGSIQVSLRPAPLHLSIHSSTAGFYFLHVETDVSPGW